VLGGTGSVGRQVVEEALNAGHEVTVLGRDPAHLGSLAGRVDFVQGEVTDPRSFEGLAGAQAVISTLSADRSHSTDLMTRAMTTTIEAMRRAGVRRLVVLTNASVLAPGDRPTLVQRLIRAILERRLGRVNADHRGQAAVVRGSGLDWTIVRAPRLVDRPAAGRYRVGNVDARARISIGRSDLAGFIFKCAATGQHQGQLPMVSG